MADGVNSILDSSSNKIIGTDKNKISNDTHCVHCDQLKRKLQKAKVEISLYEEILKLLQEEVDTDLSTLTTPESKWRKDLVTILPHIDSYEQWDNVFGDDNVNEIFNNFLNTYLR
jgi:hypothetical protein